MTVEFLIHAIVRQTMILIAQLATLGGGRAPLAQVADQVFVDLVRELERQGVSRKVSADMFGLGLRTYRRKIQRLNESVTERGRSLWEVVLEFIKSREFSTRSDVLSRFARDDEAQLRAVLRDLCESQLIMVSGSGPKARYRAASDEELADLRSTQGSEGYDDLLVALLFREGPLTLAQIAHLAQVETSVVEAPIARLAQAGRLRIDNTLDEPRYQAQALVIPLGASVGWEGAVFDHFKAMVSTVLVKLRGGEAANAEDQVGGSTYTIDVWPGHPLEEEVLSTLGRMRTELSELRKRAAEASVSGKKKPRSYSRVVIYAGQCVIPEEPES
jgi:hypothetical protein